MYELKGNNKMSENKEREKSKVIIYTDGACSGNPGPRRLGSYTYV